MANKFTREDDVDNWDKVMKLAEQYGFIIQAYGGVATLATHEEQKKAGIFEKTQKMCHGKRMKGKLFDTEGP